MIGNRVGEHLNASFQIISLLIIQTHRASGLEWMLLIACAGKVSRLGDDSDKKYFARMLHDGAHQLEENGKSHEAAVVDYINVNFRIWCKPLLDSLDSFMGDDPVSSHPLALSLNHSEE